MADDIFHVMAVQLEHFGSPIAHEELERRIREDLKTDRSGIFDYDLVKKYGLSTSAAKCVVESDNKTSYTFSPADAVSWSQTLDGVRTLNPNAQTTFLQTPRTSAGVNAGANVLVVVPLKQ
jgi:hypothetical protein